MHDKLGVRWTIGDVSDRGFGALRAHLDDGMAEAVA